MITAEFLLHPVRLRILQAVLDGHPLTTTQIRARVPDISPATVYRHVAVLAEAGILEVVDEQRVRGAMERTYRMRSERAEIDPESIAAMSPADHRRAFMGFVAGLLAHFDRYLGDATTVNPREDGVTYRQGAVWLTKGERDELLAEMRAAVASRASHPPGGERRRFLVSAVLMPAEAAGQAHDDAGIDGLVDEAVD